MHSWGNQRSTEHCPFRCFVKSWGADISSLAVWRAINIWYGSNDKTDHRFSVFSQYLPSTRIVKQSIHHFTCQVRCMTSQPAEYYTNWITWCSDIHNYIFGYYTTKRSTCTRIFALNIDSFLLREVDLMVFSYNSQFYIILQKNDYDKLW